MKWPRTPPRPWDLDVGFIEYDLDLATKRWDEVNRYYEYEIYRKWGELKSSLFLIEEVEGEVQAAKDQKMKVSKAEAQIKEARKLFEVIMRRPGWLHRRHGLCLFRHKRSATTESNCLIYGRALARPFIRYMIPILSDL